MSRVPSAVLAVARAVAAVASQPRACLSGALLGLLTACGGEASTPETKFDAFGTTLRYARVAPNVASAAANVFSTADASCSMTGVWDTAAGSENPGAAFAFDADGQWIGGERGANLCDRHFMFGTYELSAEGFHLVTNVGAGRCDYWFDAYFGAAFSADCNQVTLSMSGDTCTGGRGYLNYPGDVLIRRQPSR